LESFLNVFETLELDRFNHTHEMPVMKSMRIIVTDYPAGVGGFATFNPDNPFVTYAGLQPDMPVLSLPKRSG